MTPSALVLSFHASYGCRHSGACCTSGWPIPVERPRLVALGGAIRDGRLSVPGRDAGGAPFLVPAGLPPDVAALTTCDGDGVCAFYRRGSGLCAIHAQLGPEHLPASCAHFPRVCLIDEDAVYVTLSHYCPTVADLLFEPAGDGRPSAPAAATNGSLGSVVVPAPTGLLAGLRVEGLDARGHLPPLLRPGLLTDRRSYRAWERFVVGELAEGPGTAEARLGRAAAFTEDVREWRPSTGPSLEEHIERCIGLFPAADTTMLPDWASGDVRALYDEIRASCPAAIAPAAAPEGLERLFEEYVEPGWPAWAPIAGRYLAAKAFGSWCAYQGHGVRTVLRAAGTALAVLRVEAARQCERAAQPLNADLLKEAVRQADLLIVHLASREELAARLSRVESIPPHAWPPALR